MILLYSINHTAVRQKATWAGYSNSRRWAWARDRWLWRERLWEKEGFKTPVENAMRNVNNRSQSEQHKHRWARYLLRRLKLHDDNEVTVIMQFKHSVSQTTVRQHSLQKATVCVAPLLSVCLSCLLLTREQKSLRRPRLTRMLSTARISCGIVFSSACWRLGCCWSVCHRCL